jgi:transcriptional regulator of acetoin/glycerol metabolism
VVALVRRTVEGKRSPVVDDLFAGQLTIKRLRRLLQPGIVFASLVPVLFLLPASLFGWHGLQFRQPLPDGLLVLSALFLWDRLAVALEQADDQEAILGLAADHPRMYAFQRPVRGQVLAFRAPDVGIAEQAAKEKQNYICFLEALLSAEVEEREQNAVARRIKEAHFPKVKTLEEFDFQSAQHLPATLIRHLSEGGYIGRTEPVLLLGEAGTGKTHLATGLGVAACRQRKRVRFTTAAEMVNELVEARHNNELSRVTARWTRYELLVID